MDPITAISNLITALTQLAQTIAEGQPPDVRAELWRMYLADVKHWRKLFKIDEPDKP